MSEQEKEEPKVIVLDPTKWKVPECCSSGSPDCPHVAKKERKIKQNVGL